MNIRFRVFFLSAHFGWLIASGPLINIQSLHANICMITDFGAKADAITENSVAIQKAIDQCAGKGDTVIVPPGTFLSGPIQLKSRLVFHIDKGGIISGTVLRADYAGNAISGGQVRALLHAYDATDITLTGEGIVDGNGGSQDFQQGDNGKGRPRLVEMVRCSTVTVRNLTLRNSAFWTAHFLACVKVRLNGLTIDSRVNWNNDGLDIDSKDVEVSDCTINTDDDALCLKSNLKDTPCEKVTVRRCIISSQCNAIKLGTASKGGFKNIDIGDIDVRVPFWYSTLRKRQTALAGIAIESVDGGALDSVNISNIKLAGIMTPIFIKLGNRQMPVGTLRNVTLSHIIAFPNSGICSNITGIPGGPSVENITLSDILIHIPGKGTAMDAAKLVPEVNNLYPEILMFSLPAFPVYGIYVRHAKNITLKNIQYNLLAPDARPSQAFLDVVNLDTTGIRFTNLPLSDFTSNISSRTSMHNGIQRATPYAFQQIGFGIFANSRRMDITDIRGKILNDKERGSVLCIK
jgi:polygalacturonase